MKSRNTTTYREPDQNDPTTADRPVTPSPSAEFPHKAETLQPGEDPVLALEIVRPNELGRGSKTIRALLSDLHRDSAFRQRRHSKPREKEKKLHHDSGVKCYAH